MPHKILHAARNNYTKQEVAQNSGFWSQPNAIFVPHIKPFGHRN